MSLQMIREWIQKVDRKLMEAYAASLISRVLGYYEASYFQDAMCEGLKKDLYRLMEMEAAEIVKENNTYV